MHIHCAQKVGILSGPENLAAILHSMCGPWLSTIKDAMASILLGLLFALDYAWGQAVKQDSIGTHTTNQQWSKPESPEKWGVGRLFLESKILPMLLHLKIFLPFDSIAVRGFGHVELIEKEYHGSSAREVFSFAECYTWHRWREEKKK